MEGKESKIVKNTDDKEKGITLIALTVTIAIIMILAGVTINAIVGDDGLIKKAQIASNDASEIAAKEKIKRLLEEYELVGGKQDLEKFLEDKIPSRIDSVKNNGDGTLTISKNGYTMTINESKKDNTTDDNKKDDETKQEPTLTVGTAKVVANSDGTGDSLGEVSTYLGNTLYINFTHSITGGTTAVSPSIPYAVTANGTYNFTVTGTVDGKTYAKDVTVTVNQFKDVFSLSELKIGDYVNYTYDTASSYTLSSTYSGYSSNQTIAQTKNLKWQVLNVDKENDTVDIISEKLTDTNVYFNNVLGYNNGPYLMNKICEAQYSNSSLNAYARSINLLDMEKHLTKAGISARNASKTDSTLPKYGTTKTFTTNTGSSINTKYPSLYANQKGAGVNVKEANATSIVQPDLTKGNDPYEESKKIATTEPTTNKTYGTANPLTVTQTDYFIGINQTNYGDAANVLKISISNEYWVASRCVSTGFLYNGSKLISEFAYFSLRYADNCMRSMEMFESYGNNSGDTFGERLRPVVSLSLSVLSGTKDSTGAWNLK